MIIRNYWLPFSQNFSRTDRLLRHRRMCVVGIPKEENTPCCEGRSYPQEPSQQSWSPLQANNSSSRLAVWWLPEASGRLRESGVVLGAATASGHFTASDWSWRLWGETPPPPSLQLGHIQLFFELIWLQRGGIYFVVFSIDAVSPWEGWRSFLYCTGNNQSCRGPRNGLSLCLTVTGMEKIEDGLVLEENCEQIFSHCRTWPFDFSTIL